MRAHPRTISYLQRALNHEFGATLQYSMQAALADTLGLDALAAELREGVQEELRHAGLLMRAMYAIGVTPHAGQPRATRVGRTQAEMLRFGHQTEIDAIRIYREACRFCDSIGDVRHAGLFAAILDDEIRHCRELEQQLSVAGAPVN